MDELRAPDPTLIRLPSPTTVADDVGVTFEAPTRASAHRLSLYPDGDPPELSQWWPSCDPDMEQSEFVVVPPHFAAYTAAPCPDCFPNVTPRGVDPQNRPNAGRYLAWQMEPPPPSGAIEERRRGGLACGWWPSPSP